jgi:hypothetical protein
MKRIDLMATVTIAARLRSGPGRLSRRLRFLVNSWIAHVIAARERQVALFASRNLTDCEAQNIGIHSENIVRGFCELDRIHDRDRRASPEKIPSPPQNLS